MTPSSAVLHGSLDAKAQPTNYVFQYGTTKFYGGQTPLAPGGQAPSTIQVSQAIGGLQANTTYHYRILATSARGATPGRRSHLQNTQGPAIATDRRGPQSGAFRGSRSPCKGTLAGTGNAGRVVALQTNPFPYVAGFKTLGNFEVTSSTGSFSFPVVGLLANTQLRVVTTSAPSSQALLWSRASRYRSPCTCVACTARVVVSSCVSTARSPRPSWARTSAFSCCAVGLLDQSGRDDRHVRHSDRLTLQYCRAHPPSRCVPGACSGIRRLTRLRLQRAHTDRLTSSVGYAQSSTQTLVQPSGAATTMRRWPMA